ELVDDLQRPGFGRTGQRSGREGRAQNVDGRGPGLELTADGRADVHDVAVADDVHELADVDRPGGAHLRQVVAGQIDEHEVFGAPGGVPAGKAARRTSMAVVPGSSSPRTAELVCMMWLERTMSMNSLASIVPAVHTFARSLRARSTSMRCSARSFSSSSSSRARESSASGVAPRGREPAIGWVTTSPERTVTRASGEEPMMLAGCPASSWRLSRYMKGLGFEWRSIR